MMEFVRLITATSRVLFNKSDSDNVDAIVLSKNIYKTGDEIEVEVIGMISREDGDHKVIVIDDSVEYQKFRQSTHSG